MRDLTGFLTSDFWRDHARGAAYCCWGFLAFVAFTAFNFPYTQALSAAVAPLGMKASWSGERFKLPVGVEIQNLRLTNLSNPGAPPAFESESMGIAPTLSAILLGRPAIHLRASLYGGDIEATLRGTTRGISAVFDTRNLSLARYRGLAAWGFALNGEVSASGAVSAANGLVDTIDGRIDLHGKSVTVRPGFGLPDFAFTNLEGNATMVGGVVTIDSFHGSGADGSIDLSGTIRLASELRTSMLNLALRIEPSPEGSARLGFLMRLLPRPPGVQPYRVGGSMAQPIFS
ncbi:MAG TPA: type II secretion system protein GspN [Candidatus Binataceae bacterium]